MALTPQQLTAAQATLKAVLDPIKNEGARVTLSPVTQGPLSKGELQVFYSGSTTDTPATQTFNAGWRQQRTINYQVNLLLKDLREPEAAVPLLESIKGMLSGLLLFGEHPETPYMGGLYPVRDNFRRLNEEAFWYYEAGFACQIFEWLPEPAAYVPPTP